MEWTVLAYAAGMTDDLDFISASQKLAGLEHLDVAALEVLYKLECSGEDFYNVLAERIGNDEAAELLRRNGREEMGHARRVGRAIAIKQGHDFAPSVDLQERYSIELPPVVDAAMLPGIVQGEQAGDAGYQKWAEAEPDPEVARLLRLNGREETLHGERVTQVIAILGSSA
jgi:rubrerythrin